MCDNQIILVAVIAVLLIFLWIVVLMPKRCHRACCRKQVDQKKEEPVSAEKYEQIVEGYHPGMTEVKLVAGDKNLAFNQEGSFDPNNILF